MNVSRVTDMHRAALAADWTAVPPESQNLWQRMAARTNGVVTPGNFFTVLGVALVMAGLITIQYGHIFLGLLGIGVGRLCDIFDGLAAAATGTKSPLGEMLDSTSDKFMALAALILLTTAHVIPLLIAGMVLLPNVFVAIVVFVAELQKIRVHPSRLGKLSAASCWVGLVVFVLAAFSWAHGTPLKPLAYVISTVAFIGTSVSGAGYLQQYLRGRRTKSARP